MNPFSLTSAPAALRIAGTGVAGWAAAVALARAGRCVVVSGSAPLLPGPLPAPIAALRQLEQLAGVPLAGWWPATGLWLADDWPAGTATIALWQPTELAKALRRAALATGAVERRAGAGATIFTPATASAWQCWPGRASGGRSAWAIIAHHGGIASALLARAPGGHLLLAGGGRQPAGTLPEMLLAAGGRWAATVGSLALDPQPARRWLPIPPPLSARPALILPEPGPLGLAALVERLAALASGTPLPNLLPETLSPPILPKETDDEARFSAAAAAAHRLWRP